MTFWTHLISPLTDESILSVTELRTVKAFRNRHLENAFLEHGISSEQGRYGKCDHCQELGPWVDGWNLLRNINIRKSEGKVEEISSFEFKNTRYLLNEKIMNEQMNKLILT